MEKCDKCGYEEQEGDNVFFFESPINGKTYCQKCANKPIGKEDFF